MGTMNRSILSAALSIVFVGAFFPTEVHATDAVGFYSVDQSVEHYPVGAAVRNWDQNMIRVSECTQHYIPCVEITERPAPFGGKAARYWMDSVDLYWSDKYQSLISLPVGHIELLYNPEFTWRERRMIICHEFGHFLGVDHNRHACMRSYVRESRYSTPDPKPYAGDYNRGKASIPTHWQ